MIKKVTQNKSVRFICETTVDRQHTQYYSRYLFVVETNSYENSIIIY